MPKEWAEAFYSSGVWQRQRELYREHAHGICERCGEPGVIVHHRRELTPETINNPRWTLDFRNLELVCRGCHKAAHGRSDAGEGLIFDARGELVPAGTPPGAACLKGGRPPNRGPGEN